MRLTLRTLLAWLDDMLPSDQVRQIGQQVDESPLAREILERIERVTRQRRLTTPNSTGSESTDRNLVAEYLDNVMTPDQVVEFEKKCLTSDVHLAEVASVHQIMSLLGQKARVPPEARYRMYQLVKGRETAVARTKLAPTDSKPESVAATLPKWKAAPATPQPWKERARPLALLAVLLGFLGISTWVNLTARPSPSLGIERDEVALARQAKPLLGVPGRGRAPALSPVQGGQLAPDRTKADQTAAELNGELAATMPEAEQPAIDKAKSDSENRKAVTPAERPTRAGALGSVLDVDGVLLRRASPDIPWDRAKNGTAIEPGDVLVGLDPYRSSISLGHLKMQLVKTTRVELRDVDPETSARLRMQEGRLVLLDPGDSGQVVLDLGKSAVALTLPRGVPVGIERELRWQPGQKEPFQPSVILHVPEGDLTVRARGSEETITGPGRLEITAEGRLGLKQAENAPNWVTEVEPPVLEKELGRHFSRYFKGDQPPLPNLVEAATSDQPEIRDLAFHGLGAINQLSVVISALNATDQPDMRRSAIETLRDVLARGEPSLTKLREELVRSGDGPDWSNTVESLLVGLTLADLPDGKSRQHLVDLLSSRDVGLRELALDNLMRLLNRGDSLGYDPDKPTPDKVKAWQDLLDRASERKAR